MENASVRRGQIGHGLCLLIFAGWSSLSFAQQGIQAGVQELKLSTALGPAYPLGKAGEIWASRIRERSGGRIVAKHIPGAGLSQRDPTREFAALKDGGIDLAVGSAQVWSQRIPELNLFTLPWLVRNDAALEALVGDASVREMLTQRLERAGVVAIEWAGNGFLELATRFAAHKPADLDRSRIRTVRVPLIEDTLVALRAVPSTMTAAEARAAAASGMLDGQLTSTAAYAATRSYADGFVHLLLWNAHADALVFAANQTAWNALTERDRETVREAAKDAARLASAMHQELTGDSALAVVATQGAEVHRLTPAGKAVYRQATEAVYKKWSAVIGADLVRAAEAAVAAPNAVQ
jgi:TRAP-type C4-dicarboxylate transport system substrate-binding protein